VRTSIEKYSPMTKEALISECGDYRYKLSRVWDQSKSSVMFIMLNPSTADAEKDDRTITRCINFAKSWGYGGIMVGNLYAYRATSPEKLSRVCDPLGPDNLICLRSMAPKSAKIICAWGHKHIVDVLEKKFKVIESLRILLEKRRIYYLELSKNGVPKHPLYLKKELEPKIWLHG